MSVLSSAGSLALQGFDFQQAYDDAKDRMSPLFKQRPIGGVNTTMDNYRRRVWRNKIDKPSTTTPFQSWFTGKSASEEHKMTNLSHEKLAGIIYQNGHVKTAGAGNDAAVVWRALSSSPLRVLGLGLGAGVIAKQLYAPLADKYKAEEAYPEMFNKFPELKDVEPSKVDDYWNIMREYSPAMTHNPIVAGQFIKNMVDFGMNGIDHPTLKSIIDLQGANEKSMSNAPMGIADVTKLMAS